MIHPIENRSVANGFQPAIRQGGTGVERETAVQDQVSISREAQLRFSAERDKAKGISGETELSEEEKRQVAGLKKRDQEVRAHERAHIAAGGGLVQGGASYQFQRGPDGRMYAVGGEVQIDVSSERDSNNTISKMQQVRRAALAPANPSGTDRSVAARASQIESQARQQKTEMEKADREMERVESPQLVKPGVEYGYTNAAAAIESVNSDVSVHIFG